MYSPQLLQFNEAFRELRHLLLRLGEALDQAELHKGSVFRLPRLSQSETHLPYQTLEVLTVTGSPARALAIEAYADFYAEGDESTKAVMRLPGALVITPRHLADFLALVADINRVKNTLHEIHESIYPKEPLLRHRMIRQAHPRLMINQVTRVIKLETQPLYSATFTWARKDLLRKLDKHSSAELVGQLRYFLPDQVTEDIPWETRVEQEVQQLLTLPADIDLRYRRPAKPHPMMNLLYEETRPTPRGKQRIKKIRDANIPALIIGSPHVLVGRLKDYNPAKKNAGRRKHRQTQPDPLTPMAPIFLMRKNPSVEVTNDQTAHQPSTSGQGDGDGDSLTT